MAIHLIIKGNTAQAYRAAADHGISLNQCHTNVRHPDETNARCANDYRVQVTQWFCEGSAQAPFPTGTLLLFTEGKGEES